MNSGYFVNSLSCDNLSVRRAKQKANLKYKFVNKLAPVYLCNMFTPKILSFDLCGTRQKLCLKKPRTNYLKHSFSYSRASLWDDLPEELCTTKSLDIFKRTINKWFSAQDFHIGSISITLSSLVYVPPIMPLQKECELLSQTAAGNQA